MEGFWGMLKSEMYYLKTFHTYEELKQAVTEY
ncbi:IS3 family transposase, partial [Eubacteriales bacterium DFI.9.88]|nr:IS3 family transposase [Eubacteriales bacterium DFI.9.88]